jgi:hypothetical protein
MDDDFSRKKKTQEEEEDKEEELLSVMRIAFRKERKTSLTPPLQRCFYCSFRRERLEFSVREE